MYIIRTRFHVRGDAMIDKTDVKILKVLQENGRKANKDIAAEVGMVPSAISERIKKLKERKIIKAFETRIDAKKVEKNLLAFVYVTTNEQVKGWGTGKALSILTFIQVWWCSPWVLSDCPGAVARRPSMNY